MKRAIACVSAAMLAGCAPPGLASMPLPAPSLGSDSYTLTAKFANALNLPAQAKVRLGGADIGEVASMTARDYTAVVRMRIRKGVRLPAGSTAELRTATPLGDVFVAVKPPANPGSGLLRDGDVLGLKSTAAAATVEAVLSSAAVLVNGGVVRNATKVLNGLGEAAGDNGAVFGDLVRQSSQLLGTLDGRSQQIQGAVDNAARLAATLNAQQGTIDDLLDAAPPALAALDTRQLADTVDQIGSLTRQLSKFPSIRGTDTRGTVADFNALSRAFNDIAVSPDTRLITLNRLLPVAIRMTSGTAIGADATVAKLAIGSWPDIGYGGDPEFHGPQRADWDYLIGSLKYVLYRLQERIVGQRP